MNGTRRLWPALVLASLAAACSRSGASTSGGDTRVVLDGTTYEVREVAMSIQPGEGGWFRIDGEPKANPVDDCVPGLAGGLGLYGDLPAGVRRASDLAGRKLRVDFRGDGDDASFCFVGMGGLAGAEEAWLTIDAVDGNRVTFSMSGTFKIYDENGDGPVKTATASGTATVRVES